MKEFVKIFEDADEDSEDLGGDDELSMTQVRGLLGHIKVSWLFSESCKEFLTDLATLTLDSNLKVELGQ